MKNTNDVKKLNNIANKKIKSKQKNIKKNESLKILNETNVEQSIQKNDFDNINETKKLLETAKIRIEELESQTEELKKIIENNNIDNQKRLKNENRKIILDNLDTIGAFDSEILADSLNFESFVNDGDLISNVDAKLITNNLINEYPHFFSKIEVVSDNTDFNLNTAALLNFKEENINESIIQKYIDDINK